MTWLRVTDLIPMQFAPRASYEQMFLSCTNMFKSRALIKSRQKTKERFLNENHIYQISFTCTLINQAVLYQKNSTELGFRFVLPWRRHRLWPATSGAINPFFAKELFWQVNLFRRIFLFMKCHLVVWRFLVLRFTWTIENNLKPLRNVEKTRF